MKEILILAHDIGLTVRFKPITTTEYDQWVSEGGRTRYIVTALAPELEASHLQAVTNIVSNQGFNIANCCDPFVRSSRVKWIEVEGPNRACVSIWSKRPNAGCRCHACSLFTSVLHELECRCSGTKKTMPTVVTVVWCVLTWDSTLIEHEVINELAIEAGVGARSLAEITERAMQGELDFQQSFRARVALLERDGCLCPT